MIRESARVREAARAAVNPRRVMPGPRLDVDVAIASPVVHDRSLCNLRWELGGVEHSYAAQHVAKARD